MLPLQHAKNPEEVGVVEMKTISDVEYEEKVG